MLIRRREADGDPIAPMCLRRLLGLAVVGLLIRPLFGNRILLDYALWGVPLLLVRRWPAGRLLALAAACTMAGPIFWFLRDVWMEMVYDPARIEAVQAARRAAVMGIREPLIAAEAGTDYVEVVRWRWARTRFEYMNWHALIPDGNIVLMLLGLAAVKAGVLEHPHAHRRLLRTAIAFGFLSWVVAWLVQLRAPADWASPRVMFLAGSGAGLVQEWWLAFTYIGGALLLFASRPIWLSRLSWFASLGRMAFTWYILQAALLDVAFMPYGLGLVAREALVPAMGVALVLPMMIASRWWLSRFRQGPAEWARRRLT